MTRDADLAGQRYVTAHPRAARDSHLRDDNAVFSDDHVVRDLHQVVDLRAPADDGGPQRPPVDRDVRPDLHVVVNHDVADLRHFTMNPLMEHVTESIRADDRAGVNGDALADLRAGIKYDARKQESVLPQLAVGAHVIS